MTKKLVIGCGYLGKRVARLWKENGDDVYALTRSNLNARHFEDDGITPIVGDVTEPESIPEWPVVDTVLYAVGYDRSATPSKRRVYVDGLANVIQAIGKNPSRFIYISSTSVYGQSNEEWIDEDSETNPDKEGGQICLAAEQLLMGSFPSANVLRLSGIYGPERLLSRVESLRSGKPLPGDPNAWLNLIHVDDAARVVVSCESNGKPQQRFLVSDDKPIRRGDYYSALASHVDAPPPTFDGSEARHSSGLGKRCQNQRIKDELGFEFLYPTIGEGIPHAVSSAG